MLFNVSVWVNHDELNLDCDDDWRLFPGDTFVPAPFNSVEWCYQQHDGLTWDNVVALFDTWATCPGDWDFTVVPAP